MPQLPRILRWVFTLFLSAEDRQTLTGDLDELYRRRSARDGDLAARAWLRRQWIQYPPRLLWEWLRQPFATPEPLAQNIERNHTREGEPMQNFLRDLKHSVRGLAKSPMLAATIIATVGLGIGATTVLFGVIHAVLIEPLPYEEPGQLVRIYWDRAPYRSNLSVADYLALEEQQTSFEQVAGSTWTRLSYSNGEVAERIRGKRVTPGYFSLLGIIPGHGRDFRDEDGKIGSEPTIVVSEGFWNRQLGRDPAVLGRMVRLDGIDHRLVGVLPGELGPLETGAEIFIATQWSTPPRRGPFFISALGRLAANVDRAAAAEEVRAINQRIFPLWASSYTDRETQWGMIDLKREVVDGVGAQLFLALAAVAFVLLIACANGANLLVARAIQRRRELAIRSAFGASRGRLMQYLLSESGMLALGAVLVGSAVAVSGLRLIATLGGGYIPRSQEIGLTGPVVAVLAGLAMVSCLLFGLLPSLLGARSRIDRDLQAGTRVGFSLASRRLRQGLVIGQLAVATPLLVAAALLLVSFDKLQRVDLGIDHRNVLTASVSLPVQSYPEASDVLTFWDRAQQRLASLPGAVVVGYSDVRPLGNAGMVNNFFVEDHPTPEGGADPAVPWVSADQKYFEAMGVQLLQGRLLDQRDGGEGIASIVVDQAWSKRFFPKDGAMGKRIRQGGCETCPWLTVVGIVGDVKYRGLDQGEEGVVYWPMADRPINHGIEQISQRFRYIVIRTATPQLSLLPEVRSVIRELDPALPISRVATIDELTSVSLRQPRYLSSLVGIFAGVALLLAVIGVYGVMSYFVQQHTRDIGIHIALGGGPGRVLSMIVGQGLRVIALGLAVGLGGAWVLTRFLSSQLYGVAATDALTFTVVPVVMLGAGLLACLVPAMRAAGVDPASILRED